MYVITMMKFTQKRLPKGSKNVAEQTSIDTYDKIQMFKAVILMDTGKLLDAEAMRRTCKACKTSSKFENRLIQ